MIENFVRRPQRASEVFADALRIAGGVSVIVAAMWWTATDAGVLAFMLPGLLLPRFLGVRSSFDIAYCTILLVAAWSNVFDLYTSVAYWDLLVHFACTGVLAAALYLLLARLGIVIDPDSDDLTTAGVVILTSTLGLAAGALWEMVEWVGHAFISEDIFVSYDDTIADLVFGLIGAIVAGFAVAFVRLTRVRETPPVGEHVHSRSGG